MRRFWHKRPPPSYPPAPEGFTIYAVGDIHGRADLLERVHRLIDEDRPVARSARKVEVYLGDYIDRGGNSAAVISRLIRRAEEASTIFLRGNHEQYLLDFLKGRNCWADWRAIGSIASCLSYGVSPSLLTRHTPPTAIRRALADNLPPEHLRFYADTGSYCCAERYLFVHAGIRPGVQLEDQSPADLLGIRQGFLEFAGDLGYVVVHGHTPVEAPDLRKHRINIDTGAFATSRLTCLRIDCDGVGFLTPEVASG